MKKAFIFLLCLASAIPAALVAGPLALQVGGLPRVDIPRVDLPQLPTDAVSNTVGSVSELAQDRIDRLNAFVRANRSDVEFDADKQPAVKGVLVATGVNDAQIGAARLAGFVLSSREEIEGLNLSYARFSAPKGMNLKDAEKLLAKTLPDAEIDADHIYFTSGSTSSTPLPASVLATTTVSGAALGLIDGGVADHPSVAGRVEQKGFAVGAPKASSHGTSVAALMIGSGSVRGGAPGGTLLAADVYGAAKAGGNASAIAKALGWLATRNVAVVTISLVGPNNNLLHQAVRAAQLKGMIVVAAVGNDGPAAPPSYPASYYGVLAVTGVDAKNKLLPEAGRTKSVAFAAPASGFSSATGVKSTGKVRGTSFAAPLVAGRLSLFYSRPASANVEGAVRKLMNEAVDLGKKGSDETYGNGLICGRCVSR